MEIDLPTLVAQFPWTPEPGPVEPLVVLVADCWRGIAHLAQIREHLRPALQQFSAHPSDLFGFKLARAAAPYETRIGGPLYLPEEQEWPATNGRPWIFLGQFNFSYSHDIVGALPGDLLLIFLDGADTWLHGNAHNLHFLWSHSGNWLDDPRFGPCLPFVANGWRLRTCDYGGTIPQETMRAKLAGYPKYLKYLREGGFEPEWLSYLCSRAYGTKIGGLPYRLRHQCREDCPDGKFLCAWASLGSTSVAELTELTRDERDAIESCHFMAANGFVVNIFLQDDGEVCSEVLFDADEL